jgi:hypothetical protein
MQINFVGRRLKTKDDVKLRLYEAEIPVKFNYHSNKDVQSSIFVSILPGHCLATKGGSKSSTNP